MDKQRRPCAANRCPNYGEHPGGFCTYHKNKFDALSETDPREPETPIDPQENEK